MTMVPRIHKVENTIPDLMVQGDEIQQGHDRSKPEPPKGAERSSPRWREGKEMKMQEMTLSCLQRRSRNCTLARQRTEKADLAKTGNISKETIAVDVYKASQRERVAESGEVNGEL